MWPVHRHRRLVMNRGLGDDMAKKTTSEVPQGLLRQLVPSRRGRWLPVARVRREQPRPQVRIERVEGKVDAAETPIGLVPGPGRSTRTVSTSRTSSSPQALARSTPMSGGRSSPRSTSGSRSSATRCRPSSGPEPTASRPASKPRTLRNSRSSLDRREARITRCCGQMARTRHERHAGDGRR